MYLIESECTNQGYRAEVSGRNVSLCRWSTRMVTALVSCFAWLWPPWTRAVCAGSSAPRCLLAAKEKGLVVKA